MRPFFSYATASWFIAWISFLSTMAVCVAQSTAEKAQAEWNRLKEMSKSLTAPEYVGRDAEMDLAAITNLTSFRLYVAEVSKQYSSEIKADNQPFRNLGYILTNIQSDLNAFERAAKQFGSPESIQQDFDHILMMAKRAVENQAPAYFRPENDIQRRTEQVKQRIRYAQTLAPESAETKKAIRDLEDLTKQVREIQQELSASILEQNEVPPDEYRGKDREMLLTILRDKWTKEGNKSPPLKIGIVAPEWSRGVTWEVQNRTLYKNDRSRIQGYVLVKLSSELAVRHSINLVKDHINNDKISAFFLNDPKAEPDITDQILLRKLK